MQPKQLNSWEIGIWGGLNVADQADELAARAFDGSGRQVAPVESPDLLDMDFDAKAIVSRKGSAQLDDASALLGGGETVLGEHEWVSPATNQKIRVMFTTLQILTNQSGAWAALNGPDGSTTFAHASAVSKYSLREVDGHLLMAFNVGYVYPYRNGTSLDDPLHYNSTTTTVDADSASGQKVVNVASTTPFAVHDKVIIGEGTAREETAYIASISAGVSITLTTNLANTHTGVQADVVEIANLYTEAIGGATQTVDGSWTAGSYLISSVRDRMVLSDGDASYTVFPIPTSTSGPWKASASVTFRAPGRMIGFASYVPEGVQTLEEYLYAFYAGGVVIRNGFTASDEHHQIQGGWTLLNHHCTFQARNLICFMTTDRRILGLRGTKEIDLGRRLKTNEGTGPLNDIHISNAVSAATAFYNGIKSQGMFLVPTGSSTTNTNTIVLDFALDETNTGDERLIRLLYNSGQDYVSLFSLQNGTAAGVRSTGLSYTLDSGTTDYGATAINGYWKSPDYAANSPHLHKQWISHTLSGRPKGQHLTYVDYYGDRSAAPFLTLSYLQADAAASVYGTAVYGTGTYSSTQIIRGPNPRDVHAYHEVLSFKIRGTSGNPFSVINSTLRYLPGAEVRSA